MSQNTASPDVKEIAIESFGGVVTFMDPTSLPQGVSPDCAECSFAPGGVSSRPAFKKIFANPLYPTANMTYGKTYVDPKGVIRNLYLYDNGAITVENVTTSPGVETLLSQTSAPGSLAKSITADGREYIAISDGLHGAEIPLQFDGVNLDRVTQDGPGTSPNISSIPLPAVAMVASGAAIVLNLAESDPAGGDGSGYFTAINMYTPDSVASVNIGDQITIAGYSGASAPMNATWNVNAIYLGVPNNLIELTAYLPPTTVFSTAAATGTVGGGTTMQRVGNLVTVTTAAPHQLQPGYQAQITGVPAARIGTAIASIVINNENLPGIATVTVTLAMGQASHGLIPGLKVSINGVVGTSVGTSIASITRNGQVVTVIMATSTGLSPGGIVTISGVPAASFNTTTQVVNVTTTNSATPGDTFTYGQVDADASDTSGTGSVVLNWPIPNTDTPTFFEVQSAPTATTFQVAISYADGSWTGGTVTYAWDGTFYVQSVPSATSFVYQQYGPNAITSTVGKVTPFGQAAPGIKQMQVLFLTRQGYTTAPSPPVQFVASGGQFYSVTNIPKGPSNVIARIIAFTGAQGAYFFYIPSPPQVNGQLVGTATQINDNTTVSAIFDFGDPTLFAGLGISIQGNNLANQIVLDGALGFGFYASRIFTYGQRNIINNLLNLGFDGGYQSPVAPSTAQLPTGWISADSAGQLAAGHFGDAWQITTTAGAGQKGAISQSIYENSTGAPIATPNTQYYIRVWLKPSAATANLTFTIAMKSASEPAGNITAAFAGDLMDSVNGSFLEAEFSAKTPMVIPSDYTLSLSASSVTTSPTLLVDEINIIFSDTPYRTGMIASYPNNPEGFDGVSGVIGPVNDTHPVMDLAIIRDNLNMLTQDPSGRLHVTSQGVTEPAEWQVDEVASNCGAISAFCLTRSQADDESAAGGEEWFAWYSSTGIRIYGGQEPKKISQEIQRPARVVFPGAPQDLGALNKAARLCVWGLNDPDQKQMWFGIPANAATGPSVIWTVSYLGCDSAEEIAAGAPVHRSIQGRMVANDFARKWSPWHRPMNGGALMLRADGDLTPVFFGGNGLKPGTGPGFGNAYTLDPQLKTDDDYGIIVPYYTTYGLPDRDEEQSLLLGGGMKMIAYCQGLISTTGILTESILINTLAFPWRIPGIYPSSTEPQQYNLEWPGGQATAQRFFFRFATVPVPGQTDNGFDLNTFVVGIKKNARLPVRGRFP